MMLGTGWMLLKTADLYKGGDEPAGSIKAD